MAFADRDASDISQAQQKKEFWDSFGANIRLSTSDSGVVESKAPPPPASSEKLCLYTMRWILFHKATLGSACSLYVTGKAVYAALLRQLTRIFNTPDFMGRRGASIMWELGHGTRDFYKQIVTAQEFETATAQNLQPPQASITFDIPHLMNLDGAPAGDLPSSLRRDPNPPQRESFRSHTGDGNRTSGNSNGQGTNSNRDRDRDRGNAGGGNRDYRQSTTWTPAFKQLFGSYSKTDREKLKLGAICRDCRKSVQWISERLNLAKGTCCTSVVLGQCPPTCRLSIHDVTVDDAKAAEIATVLAPSVTKLAKTVGLHSK